MFSNLASTVTLLRMLYFACTHIICMRGYSDDCVSTLDSHYTHFEWKATYCQSSLMMILVVSLSDRSQCRSNTTVLEQMSHRNFFPTSQNTYCISIANTTD